MITPFFEVRDTQKDKYISLSTAATDAGGRPKGYIYQDSNNYRLVKPPDYAFGHLVLGTTPDGDIIAMTKDGSIVTYPLPFGIK